MGESGTVTIMMQKGIRGQTHWNHNHRKQASLITWTTALSNSMKLSHAVWGTQDGQVMVERSDRVRSTGEGNGKPLQYSCLENAINTMKRQKDRTQKDERPRLVSVQYATGDQWRNNSRKNEEMEQSKNNTQLWMWLVMEVKSDAVKSNIAWEPGMLGPWKQIESDQTGDGQEWTSIF